VNEAELFKAADGLRFYWRGDVLVLRAGMYIAKNGALYVEQDNGDVFDRVTVNMPGVELRPDEFCVVWAGSGGAATEVRTGGVYDAVRGLGLFEDTRRRIDSGYVAHYAAVWRFARCPWGDHEGVGDYRVQCLDCRLLLRAIFNEKHEAKLARDAVIRLGGGGKNL
jgi:hypothetical protein